MDSGTCVFFSPISSTSPSGAAYRWRPLPVSGRCSTEGFSRSYVTVTTHGSGKPRRMQGQRRTPPLKLPRLHRRLKIADCNIEHGTYFNGTQTDDLDPKESEPKGKNWLQIDVEWERCYS